MLMVRLIAVILKVLNGIAYNRIAGSLVEGLATTWPLYITHIILDEVHERDKFADFLLIELRRMINSHGSRT